MFRNTCLRNYSFLRLFCAKNINRVIVIVLHKVNSFVNILILLPKHMSQTRKQRKVIAFWAKTLDGQFHKKQQIKKIKCPKCFETFRNDSGLKSHLFHRHTVEGRNRYPKKPKTKKKKLVTRSLTKQRQVASRKSRKRYSLEEKRKLIESYDACFSCAEWEVKNGIKKQRISDFRKQVARADANE